MAIITYPLNNIEYSAEDAELFHCTRTSGVFSADNEFSMSVTGTDNNITIGTGIAWIRNSKFSGKVVANKSPITLDLGLADGTYSRIDAVVIQFDANANKTSIVVKQGTAASTPTPPQVVRTEALYELHIYHVRRAAGATAVYAADITDLRQDETYCGIMFDDVTVANGADFMRKNTYDPDGTVEAAGGIPEYVTNNAPKVTLSSSIDSTSTTTAANSYAVKRAYDRANDAYNAVPTLSSAVDSYNTDVAATSYAVKKAYDRAGTINSQEVKSDYTATCHSSNKINYFEMTTYKILGKITFVEVTINYSYLTDSDEYAFECSVSDVIKNDSIVVGSIMHSERQTPISSGGIRLGNFPVSLMTMALGTLYIYLTAIDPQKVNKTDSYLVDLCLLIYECE